MDSTMLQSWCWALWSLGLTGVPCAHALGEEQDDSIGMWEVYVSPPWQVVMPMGGRDKRKTAPLSMGVDGIIPHIGQGRLLHRQHKSNTVLELRKPVISREIIGLYS